MKTFLLFSTVVLFTLFCHAQQDTLTLLKPLQVNAALKGVADGEELMTRSNFTEAIPCFDMAIALGCKDDYVFYERGICKYKSSQYELAILDFTHCIKQIRPSENFVTGKPAYVKLKDGYASYMRRDRPWDRNFNVYYFRADCNMNLFDYRDAVNDFEDAIAIDGNTPAVFFKKARCESILKQYLTAKNDLNTYIKLDHKNPEAYELRGLCNYKLGLTDNACTDWTHARGMGGKNAAEYLKKYCTD